MVDLYRSLASIAASEQTTSSERLIIDNYVPNAMRRWSLAVRGFLFAEYRHIHRGRTFVVLFAALP
jgi:hypothetical protein